MSNLNKAFIQAYKKNPRGLDRTSRTESEQSTSVAPQPLRTTPPNRRQSADSGVPSPYLKNHQPKSNEPASTDFAEPVTAPVVERSTEYFSTSEIAVSNQAKTIHRIDAGIQPVVVLPPWFTSVSTVELDGFVGLTSIPESALVADRADPPSAQPWSAPPQALPVPSPPPALSSSLPNASAAQPTTEPALLRRPVEPVETESIIAGQPSEHLAPTIEFEGEPQAYEVSRVRESFQPIWEVDSFQWPEVAQQLTQSQPQIHQEVGRHLRQANSTGLCILAVTSAASSQGRTTVACCLARSAAKVGLTVALIDGDLHHPALSDLLNLEVAHGWLETISENLPLEEAAIHSIEDRITLFPLSGRSEAATIAPDHPKIQAILRKLAKSFDLIVIDSQHLSHPSGRLMGCGVQTPIDAAVLVVDQNFNDDEETAESIRRLHRIGIESVGIVENFQ